MCGIIGIIGTKSRDIAYINKLNNIQSHRGPDSIGIYQDIDSNVAFAMNRLAIIDIEGGSQPFVMNNGSIIIIFNGEIYNNHELRKELESENNNFHTSHSEVEVIGNLYLKYGEKMLNKINGMFSLAVYDKYNQIIFIARDRYGIKPLYYYQHRSSFYFSSEMKVITECIDEKLGIDDQSVVDYFYHGYIKNPKTIYNKIYQLPAGHWLKYSIKNISYEKKRWWEQKFTKNQSISESDWPFLVKQGLEDAVKRWTISDVPISYLLSGGLDSTSLVTMAARISTKKIKTYTLGFEGSGEELWNEIYIARDVAKKNDTDHTEIVLDPKCLVDDIQKIVYHLDQPYGGGLPSWEIFKQISKNEKVVINGTGGDEIFGNYNRGKYLLDCLSKNNLNSSLGVSIDDFLRFFRHRFSIIKEVDLQNILKSEVLLNTQNNPEQMFKLYCKNSSLDLEDRLAKIAMETEMADDFLMMVDRFSMAHSMEARTPYLDNKLADLVFSIPTEYKIDYNCYKIMLRRAMGEFLPKSVLNAKKQGFSIPLSLWMRKPLKYLVNDLLSPSALKGGEFIRPIFYEKYVRPMLEGDNNHISLIWSALMFQLWKKNIYGVS